VDLDLSQEERLFREAIRDFAMRAVKERNLDQLPSVPSELFKEMGRLGYLSLNISEAYGGSPGSWVMIGIMIEEIAKFSIGLSHLIVNQYEVMLTIDRFGSKQIKEEFLPKMVAGKSMASLAFSEAGEAGFRIREVGSGYIVDGEGYVATFGVQAETVLLFGEAHTFLFVPLSLSGIEIVLLNTTGLFPSQLSSVRFCHVHVPRTHLIGQEQHGSPACIESGLYSPLYRILSGLICIGAAEEALRFATNYAKARKAFGKSICSFGAILGRICEGYALLEQARLFSYRALSIMDRGGSVKREAIVCAWLYPKIAWKVIEEALLIHGHYGYSRELRLQQMLRDVMAFEFLLGSEEALKRQLGLELIGREVMPDDISRSMC